MKGPGHRLRTIASDICRANTMERIVDPIISDLQTEYADAVRQGLVWKRRWVWIAGHVAFLKAIAPYGGAQSIRLLQGLTADDRRALGRTTAVAIATVTAVALLLAVARYSLRVTRPDRARQLRWMVLSGAVACSVASFASVAWIAPATNQAFRSMAAGRELEKGVNELTLRELSRQITSDTRLRLIDQYNAQQLAVVYHARWAVSFATLLFSLFALSVIRLRQLLRWPLAVVMFGAYFAYYASAPAPDDALPAFVIGWLPNVVVAGMTALLKVTPRALT